MEKEELLEMFPAQTDYWSRTGTPADLYSFEYFDSILIKYELTGGEIDALEARHFVVTERLSYGSMGEAYGDLWHKDLPAFISTDFVLHALHMSYDRILMDVEESIMIPLRLRCSLPVAGSAQPAPDDSLAAECPIGTPRRRLRFGGAVAGL